jgi:hypothetical protein
MRWAVFAGLAFLSMGTAWAQNGDSEVVIPPAPPLTPEAPSSPAPVQPALQQPPPGLVQSSPPPADTNNTAPPSPGAQPAGVVTQPPPPDVAPTQPDGWTPGTTAVLGVLNKVDGSTAQLQLPVGAQAQTTGDLSVSVQACMSRPAGQIPDVAIFLTVVPTQEGSAPIYRGWMLRSAPGATFVGNAGQTFRVIGCS